MIRKIMLFEQVLKSIEDSDYINFKKDALTFSLPKKNVFFEKIISPATWLSGYYSWTCLILFLCS